MGGFRLGRAYRLAALIGGLALALPCPGTRAEDQQDSGGGGDSGGGDSGGGDSSASSDSGGGGGDSSSSGGDVASSDSGGGDNSGNSSSGGGDNPDNTDYYYEYASYEPSLEPMSPATSSTGADDPATAYAAANYGNHHGSVKPGDPASMMEQNVAWREAARLSSSGSSRELAIATIDYAEGLIALRQGKQEKAGALFGHGQDAAGKARELKDLENANLAAMNKAGKDGAPKTAEGHLRVEAKPVRAKGVAGEIKEVENLYHLEAGGFVKAVVRTKGDLERLEEELGKAAKAPAILAAMEKAKGLDPAQKDKLIAFSGAKKLRGVALEGMRKRLRAALAGSRTDFSATWDVPSFSVSRSAGTKRGKRELASASRAGGTDFRNLSAGAEEFFPTGEEETESTLFDVIRAKYHEKGLRRRLGL